MMAKRVMEFILKVFRPMFGPLNPHRLKELTLKIDL